MKFSRRLAIVTIVGLSGILVAQDPSVLIRTPDLSFVLRGFTGQRSWQQDLVTNQVRFSGTGNPVVAEMNNLGITLQGNSIQGQAERAGNVYVLREATLTGDALAIVSTEVRENWEIGQKRREIKSQDQTITRISGPSMTYSGTAAEGTAKIPGTATIRVVTRGVQEIERDDKKVSQRFEQIVEITSANATVTVDPSVTGGRNQLKTGVFEGPVNITITRTERDEGAEQGQTSTYTAKGDRMVADFTGADKKISLTGNVQLGGTGTGFLGTATAGAATIFVNDEFRPIRYDFSGNPAETRVRPGADR